MTEPNNLPEIPEFNHIPVWDVPDELMNRLTKSHAPAGGEDPYQGFDIHTSGVSFTSFSIDYMTQNLWFRRGLLPSDLQYLPTGKIPVPAVLFMLVGDNPNDERGPAPSGLISPESKTIILHTSGMADIVEVGGSSGREVISIELVVDYTKIEVVDRMPTVKED